jgi:hypothetical protein
MVIDTDFKLNSEMFFTRIAASSLSDITDAYDGCSLDEDGAHRTLMLIKGRMETMIAFLDAVERDAQQPSADADVQTIKEAFETVYRNGCYQYSDDNKANAYGWFLLGWRVKEVTPPAEQ